MLTVTNKHLMLSVIMLNVLVLSVVMLSLVAPLERLARVKHSSLLRKYQNYGQKSFITLVSGWSLNIAVEFSMNRTRGLYYKTFYGHNLRIFVIS